MQHPDGRFNMKILCIHHPRHTWNPRRSTSFFEGGIDSKKSTAPQRSIMSSRKPIEKLTD